MTLILDLPAKSNSMLNFTMLWSDLDNHHNCFVLMLNRWKGKQKVDMSVEMFTVSEIGVDDCEDY